MVQTYGNIALIEHRNTRLLYDIENNNLFRIPNEKVQELLLLKLQNKNAPISEELDNDTELNEMLQEINFLLSTIPAKRKSVFNSYRYLKSLGCSTAITLMITQSCNLRCKYCYGGESGKFNSKGIKMSFRVAKAAIDFLINSKPEADNFQICLFGGEPLLNFKLIQKIFQYCDDIEKEKKKKFTFTMTTNATLLDEEKIEILDSHNVSIMISLDGDKNINDINRVFINGQGTFDSIISSINLLKKHNYSFIIRATQQYNSFDKFLHTILFFKELGASKCYISDMNEYNDDSHEFSINIEEIRAMQPLMMQYMRDVEKQIVAGKKPFYVPFSTVLQMIHFANRNMISCGIMRGTTAVSSEGNLYPCHRFVGIPGYVFGNVFNGISEKQYKKICDALDQATKDCNECFARYICARGCVREIAKNNTRFVPYSKDYCNLIKQAMEEYIVIYTNLKTHRPDIFEKMEGKSL